MEHKEERRFVKVTAHKICSSYCKVTLKCLEHTEGSMEGAGAYPGFHTSGWNICRRPDLPYSLEVVIFERAHREVMRQ